MSNIGKQQAAVLVDIEVPTDETYNVKIDVNVEPELLDEAVRLIADSAELMDDASELISDTAELIANTANEMSKTAETSEIIAEEVVKLNILQRLFGCLLGIHVFRRQKVVQLVPSSSEAK